MGGGSPLLRPLVIQAMTTVLQAMGSHIAGNNREPHQAMQSQNCKQQQYTLDLADKSRRAGRHTVIHVLVNWPII